MIVTVSGIIVTVSGVGFYRIRYHCHEYAVSGIFFTKSGFMIVTVSDIIVTELGIMILQNQVSLSPDLKIILSLL